MPFTESLQKIYTNIVSGNNVNVSNMDKIYLYICQ